MIFFSKEEQHAWDRFAAAVLGDGKGLPLDGCARFADQMIAERRARYSGKHGMEAVRTKELIALKALATAVRLSLSGEPTDLLAAFNRVEAARTA